MNPNGPQLPVNIPKDMLNDLVCECGNNMFDILHTVQTYQGILTGGAPLQIQTPHYVCIKCGKVAQPFKKISDGKA